MDENIRFAGNSLTKNQKIFRGSNTPAKVSEYFLRGPKFFESLRKMLPDIVGAEMDFREKDKRFTKRHPWEMAKAYVAHRLIKNILKDTKFLFKHRIIFIFIYYW